MRSRVAAVAVVAPARGRGHDVAMMWRAVGRFLGRLARRVMAKRRVRQAGGIVFRGRGAGLRVLVVTARRHPERWVLPKGTVERGESPEAAALREVREEAGIAGSVIGPAGRVDFNSKQGRVRLDYFLIRYARQVDGGGEDREMQWCAVEDAIRLLTYASARRVVLEAYPAMVGRGGRSGVRGGT